jgi:hypothetical protein
LYWVISRRVRIGGITPGPSTARDQMNISVRLESVNRSMNKGSVLWGNSTPEWVRQVGAPPRHPARFGAKIANEVYFNLARILAKRLVDMDDRLPFLQAFGNKLSRSWAATDPAQFVAVFGNHLIRLAESPNRSTFPTTQAGLWNRPAEILCRFDPFLDHHFQIFYSFSVGGTIRHASRQLGNFDDKRPVFMAPADNHFIAYQYLAPRVYTSE